MTKMHYSTNQKVNKPIDYRSENLVHAVVLLTKFSSGFQSKNLSQSLSASLSQILSRPWSYMHSLRAPIRSLYLSFPLVYSSQLSYFLYWSSHCLSAACWSLFSLSYRGRMHARMHTRKHIHTHIHKKKGDREKLRLGSDNSKPLAYCRNTNIYAQPANRVQMTIFDYCSQIFK